MSVDIQRGARLGMAEQICHRADIHILRNQEACIGMAQAVDSQFLGQAVLLQYLAELVCIAPWHDGIALPAQKYIVVLGYRLVKDFPYNFCLIRSIWGSSAEKLIIYKNAFLSET